MHPVKTLAWCFVVLGIVLWAWTVYFSVSIHDISFCNSDAETGLILIELLFALFGFMFLSLGIGHMKKTDISIFDLICAAFALLVIGLVTYVGLFSNLSPLLNYDAIWILENGQIERGSSAISEEAILPHQISALIVFPNELTATVKTGAGEIWYINVSIVYTDGGKIAILDTQEDPLSAVDKMRSLFRKELVKAADLCELNQARISDILEEVAASLGVSDSLCWNGHLEIIVRS